MSTRPVATVPQYEHSRRVVARARDIVQGSRQALRTSEALIQESHAAVERSRRTLGWSSSLLKKRPTERITDGECLREALEEIGGSGTAKADLPENHP